MSKSQILIVPELEINQLNSTLPFPKGSYILNMQIMFKILSKDSFDLCIITSSFSGKFLCSKAFSSLSE